MAQTVMCGQLTTGRRLTQLPVVSAPWSVGLNGAGTIEATIKLDDERVQARRELLLALEPARSFLAVLAGDDVIEAGPIWSHSYNAATHKLTVRAGGLASIFDHRLVMKALTAGENPATTALHYSGSLADIARDLVRLALSHVGGELPIIVGPDEGGTQVHTYAGHELGVLGDRLRQLTGVLGGPDIAFQPRLSDDRQGIVWELRTGTALDPLLHQPGSSTSSGGSDWVWDARAPRSGIRSLDVTRDAGRLAYRSWATGQGTGEALLMAVAEDTSRLDRGYPLLETTSAHQTVLSPGVLDMHATTGLISHMRPWTTWSLSARTDRTPRLGAYRVGDWAKVWIPDDHLYLSQYLQADFYRTRIVGYSGGLGTAVKIDLAPTMDVR